MGNALSNFMGGKGKELALTADQMADALEQTANDARTGDSAGVRYLNFSGLKGQYSCGKEKEDIDPEDLFIIEPMTAIAGWQCWKGKKPVDKFVWSAFDQSKKVAERDLPDHAPYRENLGEGWKSMLGIGIIPTDGSGHIQFTTDSISGKNALSDLTSEVAQRTRAGEPNMPVVHLDKEEFEAQDKTNWKPKFVVAMWVTREQVALFLMEDVKYGLDDLLSGKPLTKAQLKKAVS